MEETGQLHATAALSPEKECLYQSDRRIFGSQGRSGRGGEEINPFPIPVWKYYYRYIRHCYIFCYVFSYLISHID